MGLMHVQRAIQQPDGPRTIVATEVSDERLKSLEDRLAHLAESNDCELLTFNSQTADQSLHDFVMGITDGRGADDVVVSVPIAVKSTSRTPTAPRSSFARRDRVGTDTGGRMATRGLLLVARRSGGEQG